MQCTCPATRGISNVPLRSFEVRLTRGLCPCTRTAQVFPSHAGCICLAAVPPANQPCWPASAWSLADWMPANVTWIGYRSAQRHALHTLLRLPGLYVSCGLIVLPPGLWITLSTTFLICAAALPHTWQPSQWTVPAFFTTSLAAQMKSFSRAELEWYNGGRWSMGWWNCNWADDLSGSQRSLAAPFSLRSFIVRSLGFFFSPNNSPQNEFRNIWTIVLCPFHYSLEMQRAPRRILAFSCCQLVAERPISWCSVLKCWFQILISSIMW